MTGKTLSPQLSISYKVSCLMPLQQSRISPLFEVFPHSPGIKETYWDRSLVPLSTSRVSTVIPSMLMNSVAKVTSAESLASSFMASSRASMLWDWILSISWRAALDWQERGVVPVTEQSPAARVLPASAFCQNPWVGRESRARVEIPAKSHSVAAVSKSKAG